MSTHPGTFVSLLTQRIVEHDDTLIKRFENESGGLIPGMAELLSKTKTLREALIYSIFRPCNALEALIYQGVTAGF